MTRPLTSAVQLLQKLFMQRYPKDSAIIIEKHVPKKMAPLLSKQPLDVLVPVIEGVPFDTAAELLPFLPDKVAIQLLENVKTNIAVSILGRCTKDTKKKYLNMFSNSHKQEMKRLLSYPADTAGHIMNAKVLSFRDDVTVGDVINKLRRQKAQNTRSIYVVDDQHKVAGKVSFENLALAKHSDPISSIIEPAVGATYDFSPRNEVIQHFEKYKVIDIPIVDINGVFLGVIYHDKLIKELEAQATANIQTMVGASKDERALSTPAFVVSKRLPWLEINLLTAFLAAAVVGLFEGLIGKYTALAVLLPVVAGQSGNAGAQALAVTMRALAVREISIRQWFIVLRKEVFVGLLNGVAIAITTGLAVVIWSHSWGLAAVISSSMILAMVMAGIAGVLVPMTLTKFGQDPAQSSSIILTTITDVTGFFSFLGIAMLMSQYL